MYIELHIVRTLHPQGRFNECIFTCNLYVNITSVTHVPTTEDGIDSRDASQATPLLLAAENGHSATVDQLLMSGALVDACDKENRSPLYLASANGYYGVVDSLLVYHARVDAMDDHNKTSLHVALQNRHIAIALRLLESIALPVPANGEENSLASNIGAMVDAHPAILEIRDCDDNIPLTLAVEADDFTVAKMCIDLGADVNSPGPRKQSALNLAAMNGNLDILVLLLDNGADLDTLDSAGRSPLHATALHGDPRMIKELLRRGSKCEIKNEQGSSPLEWMCQWGQTAAVEPILPLCSNQMLEDGLIAAASTSTGLKTTEMLLDAGVNIDAQDENANTALHHAARSKNAKHVQLLLTRRASLEMRNHQGRTPLFDAAHQGSLECLKLLIHANADLEVEDHDGVNALCMAAEKGEYKSVAMMLKAKASLKIPSKYKDQYKSFMELALIEFSLDVCQVVVEFISYTDSALVLSSDVLRSYMEKDNDVDKIRLFLRRGLDSNQIMGDYGTMLHYAALWDKLDYVNLLLEPRPNYPDLDLIVEEHGTALQLAASRGTQTSYDTVELLLKEGANPRIGGGAFGTPLMAAAAMTRRYLTINADQVYLNVVRLLLERRKETIDIVGGTHGTALNAAAHSGSVEMIELLLDHKPNLELHTGNCGTAIHAATFQGNDEAVKLLLARGSPFLTPDTADQVGRLPMHVATARNNLEILFLVTDEDTLFLATDFQKRNILHFAAAVGTETIAALILELYTDNVNDKDSDGWTPLHWACRQSSIGMIRFLLERGADEKAVSERGWKPAHVAMYHYSLFKNWTQWREVAELLGIEEQENKSQDDEFKDSRRLWAETNPKPREAKEPYVYDSEEEIFPVIGEKKASSAKYQGFHCGICYCVSVLLPICRRKRLRS